MKQDERFGIAKAGGILAIACGEAAPWITLKIGPTGVHSPPESKFCLVVIPLTWEDEMNRSLLIAALLALALAAASKKEESVAKPTPPQGK